TMAFAVLSLTSAYPATEICSSLHRHDHDCNRRGSKRSQQNHALRQNQPIGISNRFSRSETTPKLDGKLVRSNVVAARCKFIGGSVAVILAIIALELARPGRDRLADLANQLNQALVEADHWTLRIGPLCVEIDHVLHPGDVFSIDLRNAPHILAP